MSQSPARMRGWTVVMLLGISFISGGASCPRRDANLQFPAPPPVLTGPPVLQDVVAAVNRTGSIRELSSNSVSVDVGSMPALPKLSATMSMRRDRDFRLRAGLPLMMGSGLDLGSNAERFWFEVPDGVGQILYYARHDQYQQKLDRAVLPVDPSWIMDSMGLVQINPSNVVAGPVVRPDGKLEIRSTLPMQAGVFQRVCYIDASYGHVTDQYLFDPSQRLIAKSSASRHEFYPDHQCALPHTVKIELMPTTGAPLELTLDVGAYAINQILSGDPNLFVMPATAGQMVDLVSLGSAPPIVGTPPQVGASPISSGASTTTPSFSSASYRSGRSKSNAPGPLPYRGLVQPGQ